jgi:glycosyltransferase involved in cell wall biosynthesis
MQFLPKVSILIPCYNADRWIAQAIQSALDQTYPHKEVIVVNDGSSDRSLEIIQSFGEQIRWETGANQGGNIARNRLLELSTGQWLQYLDADDYLLPDKVEQQVECLGTMPEIDILYSPSIYEHDNEGLNQQTVFAIPEPRDPWVLLARWYLPQTGSPLWRKQALLDVGGWQVGQPVCQEHELYLRLLIGKKQFHYFDQAGSVYRQWSVSTLCRKDLSFTIHHRLIIETRLEEHLQAEGLLTQDRLQAINQARFECARMEWLKNPQQAKQIIAAIRSRSPKFVPSGEAAPKSYQIVFRILGFMMAERIADLKRKMMSKPIYQA